MTLTTTATLGRAGGAHPQPLLVQLLSSGSITTATGVPGCATGTPNHLDDGLVEHWNSGRAHTRAPSVSPNTEMHTLALRPAPTTRGAVPVSAFSKHPRWSAPSLPTCCFRLQSPHLLLYTLLPSMRSLTRDHNTHQSWVTCGLRQTELRVASPEDTPGPDRPSSTSSERARTLSVWDEPGVGAR